MSTFYGSDSACLYDIGLFDVQVTDPKRLIGERLIRSLTTDRGGLALVGDDPNFGFNVRQFINGKFTPTQLSNAQGSVQSECLKDEQVSSCVATLSLANGVLTIVLLLNSSAGPFSLTLNVGALTVSAVYGTVS